MYIIWKSDLSAKLQPRYIRITADSLLMYGELAWALTKTLNSNLYRTNIRIIRVIFNIRQRQHPNNLGTMDPSLMFL